MQTTVKLSKRALSRRTRWMFFSLAAISAMSVAPWAHAALLLNDTWADGTRTNTNLPTDSADYVGIASGSGGSLTASTGKLAMVQGTSSQKLWTYFTSDLSVPNASQPHNAVTQMGVGDILTASMTFALPNTIAGSASTPSRDLRIGLFTDPTDPRVQTDVNSDGGGTGNPWQDETGYAVLIPLNSTATTSSNLFQLAKRTTSNTSLLGTTSGVYATASAGGSVFAWQQNVSYTVQLALDEVSATRMDITASMYQGSTLLSTQTVSDLGTSFGGTAIAAGGLPGSQGIYTNFDQLFLRMSGNTETSELDFTNFQINYQPVPEPASLFVISLLAVPLLRRRTAMKVK